MTTRSTPLAANALRLAVLSALAVAAHGFASDGHVLNVDAATHGLDDQDAGPRPDAVRWVTCADEGELCECPGESAARMIRFGAPGGDRAWDYARVPEGSDAILLCDALSFMHRDPAPGAAKVCQCAHFPSEAVAVAASPPTPPSPDAPPPYPVVDVPLENAVAPLPWSLDDDDDDDDRGTIADDATDDVELPPPVEAAVDDEETFVAPADFNPNEYAWSKCAAEGERCACGSDTALVRFGSTGEEMYYAMNSSWFRAHPEVRRFDYKYLRDGAVACDAASFAGSDPFPEHEKVCQCATDGPPNDVAAADSDAADAPEASVSSGEEAWTRLDAVARAGESASRIPAAAASSAVSSAVPSLHARETSVDAALASVDRAPVPDPLFAPGADGLDPEAMEWAFCAEEGKPCACSGAAVRYGSTGDASMFADALRWFRAHPEVRRWAYVRVGEFRGDGDAKGPEGTTLACGAALAGGADPFPRRRKICQCGTRLGRDDSDAAGRDVARLGKFNEGAFNEGGDSRAGAGGGASSTRVAAATTATAATAATAGVVVVVAAAAARERARRRREAAHAERAVLCARGRNQYAFYGDEAA